VQIRPQPDHSARVNGGDHPAGPAQQGRGSDRRRPAARAAAHRAGRSPASDLFIDDRLPRGGRAL